MATALITGSARGIGAAIALRLAKDGYNIALNDISEAMFEDNDIMDKIKAEGVGCEKFICDVSSYAQVEETVKAVKARFGTIDVLVNNAGITRDGLMARMSDAVAPGFIKTPMTDKLTDAQKQAMINQIAMKRYGEVDEIAGVVSFLASKDASYVTGQVIEISGGLMM